MANCSLYNETKELLAKLKHSIFNVKLQQEVRLLQGKTTTRPCLKETIILTSSITTKIIIIIIIKF